jgi:hypothetical protein
MMERSEIESLAAEILINHGMYRLPVDPFAIARKERIRLIAGNYDGCFDGRLEYHPHKRKFLLFYADQSAGNTEGRIRFTVGHELGHYHMKEHREALLHTLFHSSKTGFLSDDQMEREADWFSAGLLMPDDLFRRQVKDYRQSVCTLKELMELADRMVVSVTAAAIRYCDLDMEATSLILSINRRTVFHIPSYSMRRRGYSFIKYGSRLPATSAAAQLIDCDGLEFEEAELDAEVWYEDKDGVLWEESARLGKGGMLITYLTPQSGH